MPRVLCQLWEESERGWGVHSDGYSLHLTQADRDDYIVAHFFSVDERVVPDVYTRPCGTPYWVEVDNETYRRVTTGFLNANIREYGDAPVRSEVS